MTMIEILGPVLAITLTAQSVISPTTLPLTLRGKTHIISRDQAESWYKSLKREDDPALVAALEIALGSIPDQCTVQQERAELCLRRNPR